MKQKIYIYNMTFDSGFAPCVDNDILTLACCMGGKKGGMRKSIGKALIKDGINEVWILGLCAKTLCAQKRSQVVYSACVKKEDLLTAYDYFGDPEYSHRKDAIYGVQKDSDGQEMIYLKESTGGIHNSEDDLIKDENGQYVIKTQKFTYWGENSVSIRSDFRELAVYMEAHPRNYHVMTDLEDIQKLMACKAIWYNAQKSIQGSPFYPLPEYPKEGDQSFEQEKIMHKLCGCFKKHVTESDK